MEGVPELVSWNHSNTAGTGGGYTSQVSSDGRYVAFTSTQGASLLPPEERHRLYGGYGLFVRDRVQGKTWLVNYSRWQNGPLNQFLSGADHGWDMSEDGRWVVFATLASNVVQGDTNGQSDVFVWDRIVDAVFLVSRSWLGKPANGKSERPSFNRDDPGTVVFLSSATNLVQLPFGWSGHNVFVATSVSYGDWRTQKIVSFPSRCYPDHCYGSPGSTGGPGHPEMFGSTVCYVSNHWRVKGAEYVNANRVYCQDVSGSGSFNPEGLTSVLPGVEPSPPTLRMPSEEAVLFMRAGSGRRWTYASAGASSIFTTTWGIGSIFAEGNGGIVVWPSLENLNGDGYGVFAQRESDIALHGECPACRRRISWGDDPYVSRNGQFVSFSWPFKSGWSEPPPPPGKYGDIYVIGRPLVNEAFRLQLIDPLRPGQRHLLDASSPNYLKDELLPIHLTSLSVHSVAADGVTRIIVYAQVPGPGTLELSLHEEGWEGSADWPRPGLSALSAPGPQDAMEVDAAGLEYQTIELGTQQLPDGRWAVAGVLWAPSSFGSDPSLIPEAVRVTALHATFHADSGEDLEEHLAFEIVRPPAFLVHGIWSGPETWQYDFVRQNDPRFPRYELAKYPNDEPYGANVLRVSDRLRGFLDEMRSDGFAVTQAWGIGHSMGGQLLRRVVGCTFPQSLDPACNHRNDDRLENFYSGNLYGFVSVDSPHYGSELADLFLPIIEQRPWLELALCAAGKCPLRGALADLRVQSFATYNAPRLALPTVLMVGRGGSEWLEHRSVPVSAWSDWPMLMWNTLFLYNLAIGDLGSFVDSVLGPGHDLAVGFSSQAGGASTYAAFPYVDSQATGMHTDVTSEDRYAAEILRYLLGLDPGIFAPGLPQNTPGIGSSSAHVSSVRGESRSIRSHNAESGTLTIVTPTAGAVYVPGDIVNLQVSTSVPLAATLILFGAQSMLLDDGSTNANFTAPELHGPVSIAVVAVDAAGGEHLAQVEIQVEPGLTLLNLLPDSPELRLFEGDRVAPGISAEYADGSRRPLDASLVSLHSQNPTIAWIDQSHIVGLAVGHTLIEVSFGNAKALIPVEVTSCPVVGAPEVSVNGSLCTDGVVSLTSSPGKAYLWSTGETTQSILVTTPGSYTVETTVVGVCGATSAPVVVEDASECPNEET